MKSTASRFSRPPTCRSGGRGAARTHRHRGPPPGRPVDLEARGSSAAASTCSPPCPTWRPAALRPARPGPMRWPPVLLAGRGFGGRAVRSTPVPARRTCLRCSRRGRRRTGAPSTTPRPAAQRQAGPPADVGTGCAPGSTPAHTSGTATRVPVDARRSQPLRRSSRCRRSPPATDAEAEPGNSTHQPQPESTTPSRPASVAVGTALRLRVRAAPRTDPSERDYRTGLLPRVCGGEADLRVRVHHAGRG